MKKVAIGILLTVVVASVGFASYKLVGYAKYKTQKSIDSNISKNSKTANEESTSNIEKEGENSNENSAESSSKNGVSSSSSKEIKGSNNLKSNEKLDFSSSDAFFESYERLVAHLDGALGVEKYQSTSKRAFMIAYTKGDVSVYTYAYDNSIDEVEVKNGEKYIDKLKECIDSNEAEIEQRKNGLITIRRISSN